MVLQASKRGKRWIAESGDPRRRKIGLVSASGKPGGQGWQQWSWSSFDQNQVATGKKGKEAKLAASHLPDHMSVGQLT